MLGVEGAARLRDDARSSPDPRERAADVAGTMNRIRASFGRSRRHRAPARRHDPGRTAKEGRAMAGNRPAEVAQESTPGRAEGKGTGLTRRSAFRLLGVGL